MGANQAAPEIRVTDLLRRWRAGDEAAFEAAIGLVYEDLRRIARRRMARERRGHTLQPTALVHEAVSKMMAWPDVTFADRAHFIRAACMAMQRVLVDHARRRARNVQADASLAEGSVEVPGETGADIASAAALSQALDRLAEEDPKTAEVARLRLFAELTLEEVSEITKISVATVQRKWIYARAILRKVLAS
jgi:RNA polymerase sigma factor (TIGR02999 family)